ncbi:hypothetical protein JOL62DRAFT_328586 [Phyllosticta paracitricarpa]|uniref:Uncharacterized protein n=1 Tax=Phyllosticta paracitricarpa TaxID=2016321 RepID=A0ABR1MY42_9PEZI
MVQESTHWAKREQLNAPVARLNLPNKVLGRGPLIRLVHHLVKEGVVVPLYSCQLRSVPTQCSPCKYLFKLTRTAGASVVRVTMLAGSVRLCESSRRVSSRTRLGKDCKSRCLEDGSEAGRWASDSLAEPQSGRFVVRCRNSTAFHRGGDCRLVLECPAVVVSSCPMTTLPIPVYMQAPDLVEQVGGEVVGRIWAGARRPLIWLPALSNIPSSSAR